MISCNTSNMLLWLHESDAAYHMTSCSQSRGVLTSPPILGCLKMYMDCTGSGVLKPKLLRRLATFSERENALNVGSKSCNAASKYGKTQSNLKGLVLWPGAVSFATCIESSTPEIAHWP